MAIAQSSRNYVNVGLSCGFGNANCYVACYIDGVTWGRDTGNAAHSKLRMSVNALMHYDNLVWATGGNFNGGIIYTFDNISAAGNHNSGQRSFPKTGSGTVHTCTSATGCCVCMCSGVDYWWSQFQGGNFIHDIYGDINTLAVGASATYLGQTSGDAIYNLPDSLRVLPPEGLSVTWPTTITGSVSASVSKWANNSNIRGTPTSYGGASYWNWEIDLLDENGNYLAHKTFNTGETKSKNLGSLNSGWYTASALSGSSAANGSPYTIQAGKKYKFRVIVQNNMNQRRSANSAVFVSSPPKPTISVTSVVYDPNTKKSKMCFTWSLGASALTPEKLTYKVTTPNGTTVASGTIKTINNGAADSGTVCNVIVPTGEKLTLTVTNTAGPTGNTMTSSATTTAYSPVANAAFLGFDWDELRRECTIRAEAPGAANCRIQAGYAPNSYTIGNKLTSGQVGTLVVKDLNHGSGQILYLQATPESSDGHQYLNEIAKISVPIPNPILGLVTPSCEDIERGVEKRYIVDFVEHKKNNTCTPRWQNGDRIVKKGACPGGGEVRGGQYIDHMVVTSYTPSGSNSKFGAWQFAYNATPAFLSATNIKLSSITGYPSCGPTSPSAMRQIPTFNLTNATASYGIYISSMLWRGGVVEATIGGVKKNIARIIVNGHNDPAGSVEAYIEYWDDFSSSYVNCERIIPPAS